MMQPGTGAQGTGAPGGRWRAWTRWQDWVNLILGAWVFITPWSFAQSLYKGSPGNAWWTGAAIFVVALWALAAPRSMWAEWLNAALGVWLFVSRWVLGFGTGAHRSPAATWSAWIVGAVVFFLSLWVLARNNWGRGALVAPRDQSIPRDRAA